VCTTISSQASTDIFTEIQSGTQITSLNLKRLSAQPFVYRLYMNASSQTVQRPENNFIVSRWCAISQNSRQPYKKIGSQNWKQWYIPAESMLQKKATQVPQAAGHKICYLTFLSWKRLSGQTFGYRLLTNGCAQTFDRRYLCPGL